MKKPLILLITLLFFSALSAQKNFKQHEIKFAYGTSWLFPNLLSDWQADYGLHGNFSVAYFYRPVKWLWAGVNSVNFIANPDKFSWREYYPNGSYRDFMKKYPAYCLVLAPEVRFSFVNTEYMTMYGAFSAGVAFERWHSQNTAHWDNYLYYQITLFGCNFYLGENKMFFIGCEAGIGFKGGLNAHFGIKL
ncbi:MAG: hypothetical protein LBN95_00955 [Prevotellaceae bacterium]|jgi:hypothetical protein|nr:hypothetical protein [Prevotellaceae bacterium]